MNAMLDLFLTNVAFMLVDHYDADPPLTIKTLNYTFFRLKSLYKFQFRMTKNTTHIGILYTPSPWLHTDVF